ncbi:MAG: hypothetical protein CSA39_03670 [Flavobacteriales bacterium]|nr:MAG: hypothetical protein CR989_01845 [Flavobacteriales bacterium]PIE49232.1 MAG: hypothetical protein CSA39_03670 [Flavobacteriales bacterium]
MVAKKIYLFVFGMLISVIGTAQGDSIDYMEKKNTELLKKEQKNLDFQQYFFDALAQKAIGNYDKAIVALENCQKVYPNDKALNFEFGKNYFAMEKFLEAEEFTKKALFIDPNNYEILSLLKNIYNKQQNFKAALDIQKQLAAQNIDEKIDLVLLYIKNNEVDEARTLLRELDEKGLLTDTLMPFKETILQGKISQPVKEHIAEGGKYEDFTIRQLKQAFESEKSFESLKSLLAELLNKKEFLDLDKYSKSGIELFPAQPLVYLMSGTALNNTKQYKDAIPVLEEGLAYLIDNTTMEAEFYDQLSLSHKGTSNNVVATEYLNKAKNIRKKL